MTRLRGGALALLVALACRGHTRAGALAGLGDKAGREPPVIREASLVVFWLPASDTLDSGAGADLLDDFRYYTSAARPWFDDQGIPVVTTNADTIVVETESAPRRLIMLSGLDYPFGYVLVDPGYAEEILTGVMTDDDLIDEADNYFGSDSTDDGENRALGPGGSGMVEHFAHFRHQRGRRERLLQERGIGQQVAVLHNRVIRVARHVKHLKAGPLTQEP